MTNSARSGVDGRCPGISVVVPLRDEAESVAALVVAVTDSFTALGREDWELLLIDDGSEDDTAGIARRFARDDDRIRLLRFARNYGQSQALQAGFDHGRGAIVITMDGDLQNDPADFGVLLDKLSEGYDVVAGYRVDRADALLTRRLPSSLANAAIRWLTRLPIRDTGCTLKAFRREVIDRIDLYADQHRFLPVLAAASSGARIAEVPVRHHARRFGTSKYGLGRVPRVLADLLIMKTILFFHDRPLALFGMGAFTAFTVAATFIVASIASFLFAPDVGAGAVVFPGMSLLFVALGGHLLLLGILAEVVVRQTMAGGRLDPPTAVPTVVAKMVAI